jgi:hypothetical protein
VYVIEDIDCLTDVVLDRHLHPSSSEGKEGESLTLSFLLNLLDGVLETPGRILVITSNYPEKLDKAFVRPGRIDVKIEFTYASREFLLDMVNKFYSCSMTLEEIPAELANVFTPAEIMESMCYHFKSVKGALEHLSKKLAQKKEKEEQMATGTRLADLGFANDDEAPAPVALEAPPPTPAAQPAAPTNVVEHNPPRLELTEEEPTSAEPKEEKKPEAAVAAIPANKFCSMCLSWYPPTEEAEKEHDFAICLRQTPKHIVPPPEFKPAKEPKTFRAYGKCWACSLDHTDQEVVHCKFCSAKRREAESQQFRSMNGFMSAGMPGFGGMGGGEDAWGSAMFGDAEIPEGAGGWKPGDLPNERSDVDLNQAAGR